MPITLYREFDRYDIKPLYLQIKEMVIENIEKGDLQSGERMPDRIGLCHKLHASRPMVDRAIMELVRDGWLATIRGKGTFISDEIQQRRNSSGPLICINIGNNDVNKRNNYWGPVFNGIFNEACDIGAKVIFQRLETDKYSEFFKDANVDGLLMLSSSLQEEAVMLDLYQQHIPFVCVSASFNNKALPCVDVDNYLGVKMVVEHLVSLGHKDIAMCANMFNNSVDIAQRLHAFQSITGELGLKPDPRWIHAFWEPNEQKTAHSQYSKWIDDIPLPTAFFVPAEMPLITIANILKEKNISVPQTVSLVGFDDPPVADHWHPPLTTVRQPLEEIGRRGVRKLIEALQKGSVPEGTELLPPDIIIRESTAAPR
ncbi:MAG: GntR family transcriptional regulator [bacterium]|nr:GntR family transcriptional regulator [bacterium]